MKAFPVAVLSIVVVGTISTTPSSGQDVTAAPAPQAVTSPAVEITPFISMDSRGATPMGGAINFPLNSIFSIEAELGYRHGEGGLNALSSSANLLYALPRIRRTTPYLATGAGLAQYGTPVISREGSVLGTESRITFEVNAGGGLKVPVADTIDMRTDGRWFKSFGRQASEHWRISQGISFDVRR
jgi:hypothetical protein